MHRLLIILFVLTATTSAYAQTSAGNMMIGGALQITSTSRQDPSISDYKSFTLAPGFGYFISDNIVLGASLSLSSERWKLPDGETGLSSVGAGPFARYYKFTSNESFAIFGHAGLLFGSSKTEPLSGTVTRGNYMGFQLSPGAVYFFNEHWAMELTLQGLSISSSDPDKETDNDKATYVAFGIQSFHPSLGVRFHF